MGLFDKFKKVVKDISSEVTSVSGEGDAENNSETRHEEHYENGSGVEIGGVELPKGWENYSGGELRFHANQALLEMSNAPDEDVKAKELGFKDEEHLRWVLEKANDTDLFPELRDESGSVDVGASIKEYQDQVREQAKDLTGEGQILEPIDGVSCELWAKANATIASNGDWTDEVLTIIQGDRAKWDKVNNAWQERMSNDTTFVIAQIYGDAFNANAVGNLGSMEEFSEEHFPYEKYIEVSVAMELLTSQGKDTQQILEMFGMTVADFSNVGNYWSNKQNENLSKYMQWREELEDVYREKYEVADTNDDIDF